MLDTVWTVGVDGHGTHDRAEHSAPCRLQMPPGPGPQRAPLTIRSCNINVGWGVEVAGVLILLWRTQVLLHLLQVGAAVALARAPR